jgi:hypothetical protein
MPMPQRLVFDSPLPLVEEQRKILSALKHQDSQFIAVEGPHKKFDTTRRWPWWG